MEKIIALVLVATICLSLCACGKSDTCTCDCAQCIQCEEKTKTTEIVDNSHADGVLEVLEQV